MTGYFQRDLAPAVGKALKSMPVVAITGLRQSGKTTFLQHEFPPEKRRFITFDDFAQLSSAKADPDHFVTTDEDLTIDEARRWQGKGITSSNLRYLSINGRSTDLHP